VANAESVIVVMIATTAIIAAMMRLNFFIGFLLNFITSLHAVRALHCVEENAIGILPTQIKLIKGTKSHASHKIFLF
jgi:hypothetical protein